MNFGYQLYQSYIDRFLSQLKARLGQNLLASALFGSVARSKARPESDIDLLVLVKEKNRKREDELITLLLETHEWAERKALRQRGILSNLTLITKTEEELRDNPMILLDIADHGIILFDPEDRLKLLLDALRLKLKELGAKKVILEDGSWYWDLKPDWRPGEVVELKL